MVAKRTKLKRISGETSDKISRGSSNRAAGRPKLEDVALIDKKLLSTALKEFAAHGYGAASLNQIVKSAGISKSTLYSRYESKDQLFKAVMDEEIRRLDGASILHSGSMRPDLLQGLQAYANHMLELNLQGDLLAVNRLISSESQRFPELAASAAERAKLGVKRISGFIQMCARADGIPCQDPDSVAEAFIFMLRGWHMNAMLTNRKVPASKREQWVSRAVHTLLSARADW